MTGLINANETSPKLQHPGRLFIGGRWVEPNTAATFDVVNPATEEVFLTVAEADAQDMAQAVDAARDAFDRGPWPRMIHAERATYLRAIGAGIRERSAELGAIWTSEMGILAAVSSYASAGSGDVFDYYAGLADTYEWVEDHRPSSGQGVGLLVREPVGVVAAIIPWNSPLGLLANKVAPALLAGCTVVVKASPEAPGAVYAFAEIAEAAGLPAGVVNVVTADREVSELLVRNPGIDKVAFTGSTAAGRRIASLCGERIARCTLELGGKSAGVILDDYDLATAAQSIATSARIMTGQVCASLTRIVVSRHRHDEFVDALGAAMSAIRVGDPFDAETEMGPLAMSRQLEKVEGLIAKGCEEGATLVTGGRRPAHLERGFFIEPTVFGNVDNDSTIAREEVFGPVVSVIAADDENHAVDIANDTVYGLNASVFTDDIERAWTVSRQLRSGTVGHNSFKTDFGIAFGGFKQSGMGREGGLEGLQPYLEAKTVLLDAMPPSLT